MEHIVISCLGSKNFVDHLLHECNLVGKMLDAEKNFTLTADESKVICFTLFVFLVRYLWTHSWWPSNY